MVEPDGPPRRRPGNVGGVAGGIAGTWPPRRAAQAGGFAPSSLDALGPNRRLVFTVPSVDSPGYENVVVKLILPAEIMVTLAYMAAGADRETISPELIAHETRTAN
jgi:hypothetical protein